MLQNHIDQSTTPDKQAQRQPYQAPQLTLLDSTDTQGGKFPFPGEGNTGSGSAVGS